MEKLKFAFAKSEWCNQFKISHSKSLFEVIKSSSITHTGYLGLLKHFDTDIISVNDNNFQKLIMLESMMFGTSKHWKKQLAAYRSPCDKTFKSDEIDWGKYDVVIIAEACIPQKIIKQYPKIFWANFIAIPSWSFYIHNHIMPIYGYNLTLVDELPEKLISENCKTEYQLNKKTKINFPYSFIKSGDIFSLVDVKKKSGIHLEPIGSRSISSDELQRLKQFGPVTYLVPHEEYLTTISSRKYFVVPKKEVRFLRGNSLIEANSANCFVLVQVGVSMTHHQFLNEDNFFDGIDELISKIKELEQNSKKLKEQLSKQQKRFDDYCFNFPMNHLMEIYQLHQTVWKNKTPLKTSLIENFLSSIYPLFWIGFVPVYRMFYYLCDRILKQDLSVLISNLIHKIK